jgi:hypothetical protein
MFKIFLGGKLVLADSDKRSEIFFNFLSIFDSLALPIGHESLVARFFVVQYTKTGKNIPNNQKNILKCHKIHQMAR